MNLHVERRGAGRDLVLLHGWGTTARIWDGLVRELTGDFRLHLIDLPGYGMSEVCVPYTLEALAARIADNCPDIVAVCGWSLGAQIAMQWALARPDQITQLVLLAATPRFVSNEDWPHGVPQETFAAFANGVREDAAATLARFAALQTVGDAARVTVAKALRAAAVPAVDVLASGLEVLRETDLRAAASRIGCPALLLHGGNDRVVPAEASAALASCLPRARRTVVAGAGHAPFIAREALVASVLRVFLGDE
jgi:pimeloyl-[acyl-carrier protein] methyl ester esterase